MDKMTDNARDFEYTIVMDANYEGAVTETPNRTVERAKPAAQAPGRSSSTAPDKAAEPAEPATGAGFAREAERVYAAYEKMCLKEPTVLDKDDIYPRTYQWRAGDRYDPDKVAVVAAAVVAAAVVAAAVVEVPPLELQAAKVKTMTAASSKAMSFLVFLIFSSCNNVEIF